MFLRALQILMTICITLSLSTFLINQSALGKIIRTKRDSHVVAFKLRKQLLKRYVAYPVVHEIHPRLQDRGVFQDN